jgi:DNA-binding FrmR family transcriptional regulator
MKCDKEIIHRLKRTHGQMQGVLTMMETENSCIDLVTQLKAIRSSIDTIIGILTTHNLIQEIELKNDIKLDNLDEAINLVVKGMK